MVFTYKTRNQRRNSPFYKCAKESGLQSGPGVQDTTDLREGGSGQLWGKGNASWGGFQLFREGN